MTGRAVGRSITTSVIRFMIRANRIVEANPQALQGAPEDMRKSGSGCDETTECPLGTRARGVDQDAAAVDIAARSGPGKRINPLFQRTGWISAVQCDLGHQCVRDTVKKDIWGQIPVGRSGGDALPTRGFLPWRFSNAGLVSVDSNSQ
jgi:hypothetical protein